MIDAKKTDGRSYGELMGDAVRNSMNSLFLIGGFIILFSVILNLLLEIGIIQGITKVIQVFIPFAPSLSNFIHGICAGILEVTMGCKIVSDSAISFTNKLIAISFLIGWSGFSIHSQAAGLLGKTPISIPLYLFTKLCHGSISAFISWTTIMFYYKGDVSAFSAYTPSLTPEIEFSRLNILSMSTKLLFIILVALVLLSLFSLLIMGLNTNIFKKNRPTESDRL